DLDRRDPQTAHLDHVVGATLVPVVAFLVDSVAVAGEKPVPENRPLRLSVLSPVERESAVALDVEVSCLARFQRLSRFVEHLQLISGHWLAARSGLDGIEPGGAGRLK